MGDLTAPTANLNAALGAGRSVGTKGLRFLFPQRGAEHYFTMSPATFQLIFSCVQSISIDNLPVTLT